MLVRWEALLLDVLVRLALRGTGVLDRVVSDFLASLLVEFAIDPDDAISGGYVLLKDSGADTLVQFDQNGFGGSGPITLATVTNANVAVSDLMLDGSVIF